MLSENENTYLAKWLSDALSSEDLKELKTLEEYDDYNKIVTGLEFFNAPSFDLQKSMETTLEKLETAKKPKVIRLKQIAFGVAAAASVLLIIGLFFNKVTYTANSGQSMVASLPDGSTVKLNAASTLSHQRFFWSSDRKVTLDGEAFFKVTSGNTFTVTSTLGTVEVLGTTFNVNARKNRFEVGCYEGKVRVSSKGNQQKILQKGDAVLLEDKALISRKIDTSGPLWMQGESLFESVPLSEVLDDLERQYNITFSRNTIDQRQLFSGGFTYNNLNIALESVLVPMGINYTINGNRVSLSAK